MVIPLAASWFDVFSPLNAAAQAVLEGITNFLSYVKCAILGSLYDIANSLVTSIPPDWRTTVDTGLSSASTVFKSADIFLPMDFIVGLFGFCVVWSIAFFTVRFLSRISILGFKLGG